MEGDKILVVEDDKATIDQVERLLRREGFVVHAVRNGNDALDALHTLKPDLMILDIQLEDPSSKDRRGMDGIEVLRRVRSESDDVCVLMLSSTTINYVKVAALTMGADDYVTKPFEPEELAARVKAILRRASSDETSQSVMRFKRLTVDLGACRVWKDGDELQLTPTAFQLLCALAEKPGQVLTRSKLINRAWDFNYLGDDRLVDVHMRRLRKAIEDDPSDPQLIVTVRGKGYRLDDVPVK